jgi:V/A-type H+-transporting ATPase subunit E
MKGLETGKDKVKQICEALKRETLEPAQQEAEEVVGAARRQADEILADAHVSAKKMIEDARLEIEKQKAIFQASLAQACRQSLEVIKEKVEQKLFNPELSKLVAKPLQDPKTIAHLINAVVKAIEKEGTSSDLSAVISSAVSAREVNELLASEVIQKLKEKGVLLSSIGGGIEVRLLKNNVTLVLTDETLKELIASYIRKDFREFVFKS